MPTLARIVAMLPVRDLVTSLAFYRRLGFVVSNELAGWAWLDSGSAALMLTVPDDAAPIASVMVYLYGDNVPAMHAELAAAGIAVGPIATPVFSPRGEFRVVDPDGHALMFTHAD